MNEQKSNSCKTSPENKDNQPSEAHENALKTPLKHTATSDRLLTEIHTATSDHLVTPPKPTEIHPGEPWTPTANLKMLISAASPEIRNREQEKKCTDSQNERLEDHLSGDEYEKSQPSRKDKSLGILCHKFLARYPSYPDISKRNEICLDEVAEELNVERRRIYDILNVLESLHMVSRLAKNKYSWHGHHNLRKTLWILKKVAEENKYADQIELIKKRKSEGDSEEGGQKIDLVTKYVRPDDHADVCFVELPGMEFRGASINSRKDKSLRVMSQKFVMLFLISNPQVVSLEVAAKMLIGEDPVEYLNKSKFKTKIRRLYDIANVLSSLELIKKVHVTEEKGRKPAFKWTGPDVSSDTQDTQTVPMPAVTISSHTAEGKPSRERCSKTLFPTRSKKGLTRHPSLITVTKTTGSGRRKIRSAPSSPVKKNPSQIQPVIPNKMAQLAAICKQQLDEHSRELKNMEVELAGSKLQCSLASPPESGLKPKRFLLPSQCENLPLIPSSVSSAALPSIHSNVSYALFLQPSQTGIVTAYKPHCSGQPVPCTHGTGTTCPLGASSQSVPGGMSTGAIGSSFEEARSQNLPLTTEQEDTKDDFTSKKCFKRCKSLLEDTTIKKCKCEEIEFKNVLLGESVSNMKSQTSVILHLDQQAFASSMGKQNESENTTQCLECQQKQEKQRGLLGCDRLATSQEIPAVFSDATQKSLFPSGYFIPLPQCAGFLSESTPSNNGKTEMNTEQTSSISRVAGGIPVTSDFSAVSLPALHVTPMSLLLPSSSVATVSVVNNTAVALAHTNPAQTSSSSLMNFTLQPVRLMPASIQTSANHASGSALVCQGAECFNSAPESVGLEQGGAMQNISLNCSEELKGKSVPASSLQQATVPSPSRDSEKRDKNFIQSSSLHKSA